MGSGRAGSRVQLSPWRSPPTAPTHPCGPSTLHEKEPSWGGGGGEPLGTGVRYRFQKGAVDLARWWQEPRRRGYGEVGRLGDGSEDIPTPTAGLTQRSRLEEAPLGPGGGGEEPSHADLRVSRGP